MEINIEKTIKNLEKNNICVHYVSTKKEVIPTVESLTEKGATVASGGSVTLNECGVIDFLKKNDYNYLDRYAPGITREEMTEIFKKSSCADVYLSSCNAITENGELYNVDGNANRVSAISFGPKKIIMVAGFNKIVKDMDAAVKRVKTVAAPKNCKRLGCETYCFKTGHCADLEGGIGAGCDSPSRICRHYLVSSKQAEKGRMHVILVNEELGY